VGDNIWTTSHIWALCCISMPFKFHFRFTWTLMTTIHGFCIQWGVSTGVVIIFRLLSFVLFNSLARTFRGKTWLLGTALQQSSTSRGPRGGCTFRRPARATAVALWLPSFQKCLFFICTRAWTWRTFFLNTRIHWSRALWSRKENWYIYSAVMSSVLLSAFCQCCQLTLYTDSSVCGTNEFLSPGAIPAWFGLILTETRWVHIVEDFLIQFINICIYMYTFINIYIYICIYIYIYVYIFICIYVDISMYIYIYIYKSL